MKRPEFHIILTFIFIAIAVALIVFAYYQYTQFNWDMTLREGLNRILYMIAGVIATPFTLFFGFKIASMFKPSYDKSISGLTQQQIIEQKRANDIQQAILNEQRKGKPLPKATVRSRPGKP